MNIIAIISVSVILAALITWAGNAIRDITCQDCRLKQECEKHRKETGHTYCEENRMTRIYEQNLFQL